jgi:bacteriorhodopsin
MEENLRWLYYAFGFGWAMVFLYLFWISRQELALRKQIAALRELLQEREKRG